MRIVHCCLRCLNVVSCGRSEHRTDLKLEMLDPVARLLDQRIAIAELQRADRRIPGNAGTDRIPERFKLRLDARIIDLARVGKHRKPDLLLEAFACSGQGEEKLRVPDDLAPATDRVALAVLRPQGRRIITADGSDTASVIRLEKRQIPVAQASAIAKVASQHPDEVRGEWDEPLDEVVELIVLKVAYRH